MALQEIPNAWLRAVAHVLRKGTSKEIQRTCDFSQCFQVSFPSDSEDSVIPALLGFLETPRAVGCPVTMDTPAGETWEFWFMFKNQKTYGKILLRTDRKRIVLFSAHLPKKPLLRCEAN